MADLQFISLHIENFKSFENEVWASVPDWEGYLVSDMGRVMRLAHVDSMGRYRQNRIFENKPEGDLRNPRRKITLVRGKESRRFFVSHIVLMGFVGQRPEGQEARHLNDVGVDDRLVNLAWGTHKQNGEDAVRNGRRPKGENNNKAKLTKEQVAYIRKTYVHRKRGANCCSLGRQFGVTPQAIWCIVKDKVWL